MRTPIVRAGHVRGFALVALAMAATATLASCSAAATAPATSSSPPTEQGLGVSSAVVAAAEKEGSVTWYCSQPEVACDSLDSAFAAAFPSIKVNMVPLGAGIVVTRVGAEVQAGSVKADLIQVTNTQFLDSAQSDGWLVNYNSHDIAPIGTWPSNFVRNTDKATAAIGVGVLPMGIGYNPTLVSNPPKTWKDLLRPEFKGKIATTDTSVTSTLALLQLWKDHYGDKFIRDFAKQVSTMPDNAAPAAQDVAAGESSIATPIPRLVVDPLVKQGAPIKFVLPDLATGVTSYVAAMAKSPNPKAGQLLLAFMMSTKGQQALDAGIASPLGKSIHGSVPLPSKFEGQALVDKALANKDELTKLLTGN